MILFSFALRVVHDSCILFSSYLCTLFMFLCSIFWFLLSVSRMCLMFFSRSLDSQTTSGDFREIGLVLNTIFSFFFGELEIREDDISIIDPFSPFDRKDLSSSITTKCEEFVVITLLTGFVGGKPVFTVSRSRVPVAVSEASGLTVNRCSRSKTRDLRSLMLRFSWFSLPIGLLCIEP